MKKDTIKSTRANKVIKDVMESLQKGETPNIYQLQIKHGYTPYSAKAYKVKTTEAWRMMLENVPDDEIVSRFRNILNEGRDIDSLKAGIELLKLKDRYPEKTTKNFTIKRTIDALKK